MINYATIIILIPILPLLLSLRWKFNYYRHYKALLLAITIVALAYIIWDVIVTARGDWFFNSDYLLGIYLFGLPLEEISFFIVVPYACIFFYENLEYFFPNKKVPFNRIWYIGVAVLFILGGLLFYYQDYTILSLMSCAAFFIIALWRYPEILQNRNYWLYLGISMIPFVIFNFLLTSIPIVLYNPIAIWGGDGLWNGRFITIPFEDFFYNFSMLSFYLLAYLYFKNRFIHQE